MPKGWIDAQLTEIAAKSRLDDQERFLGWTRYCQIHHDPNRRALALLLAKALGLEDRGLGRPPSPAQQ